MYVEYTCLTQSVKHLQTICVLRVLGYIQWIPMDGKYWRREITQIQAFCLQTAHSFEYTFVSITHRD